MDLQKVVDTFKELASSFGADGFDAEAIVTILEECTDPRFHPQLLALFNGEFMEKPNASKKGDAKDFDSPAAEALATKEGLTAEDFPQKERTGRILQSGFRKICLADVKAKAGLGMGKFSSPGVATLAMTNGLSPKDFPGKKQIKKGDVEALIRARNP